MIPRETLERWKEWTEAHAALMGIIGEYPSGDVLYITAMPTLLAEVESQAKEIERLRAALTIGSDRECALGTAKDGIECPEFFGSRVCWCASCIARAALKEGT